MKLTVASENWKLAQAFTISRGSRTSAEVVVVTLEHDGAVGRGECVPYSRYGESIPQTIADLESLPIREGVSIPELIAGMKAGAARNALDCAFWDLRCKQAGVRITELLGRPALRPLTTAYTLSIDTPEAMERAAREQHHRPLLKIKSGSDRVIESVKAVRRGAPESALVVDANEAWGAEGLQALLEELATMNVLFVEQPLPAGQDAALAGIRRPLPVIADESVHLAAEIPALAGRYDGVNLKLDKTGGLTEALKAGEAARKAGLTVMCGCMVGTSLSMAPAMVLAQGADFVDLDAPLLLAEDRPEGIRYSGSVMEPFTARLWG